MYSMARGPMFVTPRPRPLAPRRGRGRPRQYGPGTAAGRRQFLAARKSTATKTATSLMYQKRKRSQTVSKVYNRGGGIPSESLLTLKAKANARVKAIRKVGAPNIYETNLGAAMLADEGFQSASYVSWTSLDDLNYIQSKVPAGPSGVGFNSNNRWILEKMTGEIIYQNSGLATAYLEIYDIVRKHDSVSGATTDPTQNPVVAWQQGSYDAAGGVGSPALDINMLKSSPFDSLIFKDYFKVVKRTRVCLTQGSVHRHAVVTSPNKLVDNSLLRYAQGDIRGMSHYTMCVVYGQPASVPTDAVPVITTAAIQLDYIQTLRYKYSWVADSSQSLYQTDNLSTLTGEQIVSVGSGSIVPNARV